MKYGFFVAIDGIVIHDIIRISDSVNKPIVLNIDAVIKFARRGLFPDVSRRVILDKSKANLLGKSLVYI